ncbi:MAG: pyridoxamine 5'-phosphate oxidase family protein [Acidobacteria bacterium]|nr:pyridoxamine 5'-phosphate oxidase family protein [Acidobacteriota bacterium]
MESPTPRTEVRRLAERAIYDREVINAILDEAIVCHVGFVVEGSPVVIPTIHARVDDTLYFHGSPASRMLRSLTKGVEVSVAVTLLDGLVVARTPFHQSLNYRSVVVFGQARLVDDPDEKLAALQAVTDHVTPGRWEDSRPPTDTEVHGTLVLALPLDEASAKVRTGPPVDDEEDLALPHWAGVVPMSLVPGEPIPAEGVDWSAPDYLTDYQRPG